MRTYLIFGGTNRVILEAVAEELSSRIAPPLDDGGRMSKSEQIRLCGNSVCPPVAEALVRANYRQDGSG